jgi:hypothetical protein
MKVKELIEILKEQNQELEVTLLVNEYDSQTVSFDDAEYPLMEYNIGYKENRVVIGGVY